MQAGYGKGEIETEIDGTKNYASYANTSFYRSEFSPIIKQERTVTNPNTGALYPWTNVNKVLNTLGEYSWDPLDDTTFSTSDYWKQQMARYLPGAVVMAGRWAI